MSCNNYLATEMAPIEHYEYVQGEILKKETRYPCIIFVLKGKLGASYGRFTGLNISSGEFFLIPALTICHMIAKESTHVLAYRLIQQTQLCENYSIDFLNKESSPPNSTPLILDVRGELSNYLKFEQGLLCDGMRCKDLMDIKFKEMLYLLRIYYTKSELADFFRPMLSNDMPFSSLVSDCLPKAKSVEELAGICNYSVSGFVKRFGKTFGTSPYKWIKQQKADRILHELRTKQKSLKDICREYDFASLAYFHAFCKREFGKTPGQIRAME